MVNAETGNLKLAQKFLGHSNVSAAADLYPQTSEAMEREAAVVLERSIWGNLSSIVPKVGNETHQSTTDPDTVNSWVKVSAQSVAALKAQLGRLRQNESISWIGKQTREQFGVKAGPLELPTQGILDAVAPYCRELGLNPHVSP